MAHNFGFWSLSNHFKNKVIPSIKSNKKIKPYVVYSRKNKLPREKYLKSTLITKNKKDLLENVKINYIYISSITKNHFNNCKDALYHNKNVICEKPICNNSTELKKLFLIAKRKKLKIFEFYHYIHHPLFKKLKQILKKNIIGEIKYIESNFTIPLKDKKNFRFKKKLGGGSLMDVGVYPISLPYFLFKKPKVVVIKKKINFLKKNQIDLSGSLLLNINKKILGSFNWGFDLPYQNNLMILGNKGQITIDFIFSKKIIQNGEIKIFLKTSDKKLKVKKFNQINATFNFFLSKKKYKILNKNSLDILKLLDKIQKN